MRCMEEVYRHVERSPLIKSIVNYVIKLQEFARSAERSDHEFKSNDTTLRRFPEAKPCEHAGSESSSGSA